MDPGKATIIGALIAVGGAIITKVISYLLENMKLQSIGTENRKAIISRWQGTTKQQKGPEGVPIDVSLDVDLDTSWRKIKGKATVKGGGDQLVVEIKGGFKTDNLLYLDYNCNNKLNFGKVILRLNANRNQLVGKIIGYGNMAEDIIQGDMTLNKIE